VPGLPGLAGCLMGSDPTLSPLLKGLFPDGVLPGGGLPGGGVPGLDAPS
jgi:hypothetical protein